MIDNKKQKALAEVSNRRSPASPSVASYFLSLELENVRCFSEKQVLDLSNGHGRPSQWTILLGENGTGKTTILQLLAAFEPVSSQAHQGAGTRLLEIPDTPRALVRDFVRIWTFLRNPTGVRFRAAIHIAPDTNLRARARPSVLVSEWEFIFNSSISFPGGDRSPHCYAYGAGRRLSNPSLSQFESSDATESLFSEDARLVNAEEWLLRLDYSASKSADSPSVQKLQKHRLELVITVLTRILPDVAGVRFTSPTKEEPNPTVEFETPYGWVPLGQLGYGYRTMIAWMVDFASRMVDRYPDSPDPLAEPAVVLVDEIDLHLHPKWQRQLIGFLTERFPNTQFIVTAHSPLMVQAAGDANIALLRRVGDHVIIENDPETIRGWSIDQILTSDLYGLKTARPPELEDLLQRRKELLTRPKLTPADNKKLAEIEARIGLLPPGESFEHAKTVELIRESMELLKKQKSHGS